MCSLSHRPPKLKRSRGLTPALFIWCYLFMSKLNHFYRLTLDNFATPELYQIKKLLSLYNEFLLQIMKFRLILVPAMTLLISGGCDVWRNTTADPGKDGLPVVPIGSRVAPLLRRISENMIVTIRICVRGNGNSGELKGCSSILQKQAMSIIH